MSLGAFLAIVGFALASQYTVPAPQRPSVPRRDREARAIAPSPLPGNLEAHRAGKRGIGEWLAALVIWGALIAWVCALVRRIGG